MDPGAPAEAQHVAEPTPEPTSDTPTFSPPASDPVESPLPAPPPLEQPQFEQSQFEQPPKRVGQLSPRWRVVFGIGWAFIIVAYAAVWESSRVIGLSTWWLGADAEPRFILINLLPFYGPILVTIAAVSNWRYSPYLGIGVACVGIAIGIGDLGRVRQLAIVELVIAGAALCISVASLAGMYRPARPTASVVATN